MTSPADGTVTFRNELEARENSIAVKFQTDGRMLHSQSYDYTNPSQMTVRGFETEGGKPFVFVVELSKSGSGAIEARLNKAISDYDKAA